MKGGTLSPRRGWFQKLILRWWCRREGIELDHLDAILIRGRYGDASVMDMWHVAEMLGGPRRA